MAQIDVEARGALTWLQTCGSARPRICRRGRPSPREPQNPRAVSSGFLFAQGFPFLAPKKGGPKKGGLFRHFSPFLKGGPGDPPGLGPLPASHPPTRCEAAACGGNSRPGVGEAAAGAMKRSPRDSMRIKTHLERPPPHHFKNSHNGTPDGVNRIHGTSATK